MTDTRVASLVINFVGYRVAKNADWAQKRRTTSGTSARGPFQVGQNHYS